MGKAAVWAVGVAVTLFCAYAATAANISSQSSPWYLTTLLVGSIIAFVAFIVAGVIYLVNKHKESQNRNKGKKQPSPNLQMVGKPYIDKRPISLTTGSHEVIGTPFFAHVKFRNAPDVRAHEANANKVYTEITFYDTNLPETEILKPDKVRFSDVPQPPYRQKDKFEHEYYEVEFNANGDPHELTIALKYKEDRYCFAFSDRSYSYGFWKKPEFLLKGDRFYVKVNLTGENTERGQWWFELSSKGIDDSLKLVSIPAPTFDK